VCLLNSLTLLTAACCLLDFLATIRTRTTKQNVDPVRLRVGG
jgi:hypothetical protein